MAMKLSEMKASMPKTLDEQQEEIEERLAHRLDVIESMTKKQAAQHLAEASLSTQGNHDTLVTRLKKHASKDIGSESKDVQQNWQDEEKRLATENEAKLQALLRLRAQNASFAELHAPELRVELKKRGLSAEGRKELLLDRLAEFLQNENGKASEMRLQLSKRNLSIDGDFAELEARLNPIIEQEEYEVEERLADAEQRRANKEYKAATEHLNTLKKPAIAKQLKQRKLDAKGTPEEMKDRLLEAMQIEKRDADLKRQPLTIEEKKAVAEARTSGLTEVADDLERQAKQRRLKRRAASVDAEQDLASTTGALEDRLAMVGTMSKKRLVDHLSELGQPTKGDHDTLVERLKAAVSGAIEHETDAQRAQWEAEEAIIAAEAAEKMEAFLHLKSQNKEMANMKAPALRRELQLRDLSTMGSKTQLLERLAVALDEGGSSCKLVSL